MSPMIHILIWIIKPIFKHAVKPLAWFLLLLQGTFLAAYYIKSWPQNWKSTYNMKVVPFLWETKQKSAKLRIKRHSKTLLMLELLSGYLLRIQGHLAWTWSLQNCPCLTWLSFIQHLVWLTKTSNEQFALDIPRHFQLMNRRGGEKLRICTSNGRNLLAYCYGSNLIVRWIFQYRSIGFLKLGLFYQD